MVLQSIEADGLCRLDEGPQYAPTSWQWTDGLGSPWFEADVEKLDQGPMFSDDAEGPVSSACHVHGGFDRLE